MSLSRCKPIVSQGAFEVHLNILCLFKLDSSFLFSVKYYSEDVPQFILHLLTEGYLSYFEILATMNKGAINICMQVFIVDIR